MGIEVQQGADDGFGLISTVVGIFLLAIVAIALIPGLVSGLRQSQTNAIIGTATQLVNQQLEDAKSHPTCSSITPVSVDAHPTQRVTIHVVRSVGVCPSTGYPQAIPVTATATRSDTGAMVTATTSVFVTAQ